MNYVNKIVIPLAILSIIASAGLLAPAPADTKSFESMQGLEYDVSFKENFNLLKVGIENDESLALNSTFGIDVDGWQYNQTSIELQPGEHYTKTFNITDGLDVMQEKHSITVSTYEGRANFSFERNYSSLDSGSVPIPQINDVRVGTGKARGSNATIVYVTVENPSEHVYSAYVVAHTQETTGSTAIANPLPGNSQTVELELYEPIGSSVHGEIRMFMGKPNESRGALEQVAFSGSADESTNYRSQSYEPFEPPWEEDAYEYYDPTLPGTGPLGYTTAKKFEQGLWTGFGLLVLGAVVWWRRR